MSAAGSSSVLASAPIDTTPIRARIERLTDDLVASFPKPESLTAEERRMIANASGFLFETSNGDSIYHALQARVSRRFRRGIAVNALYTFGKSIDNSSTFGGAGNTVAQDANDLRAERDHAGAVGEEGDALCAGTAEDDENLVDLDVSQSPRHGPLQQSGPGRAHHNRKGPRAYRLLAKGELGQVHPCSTESSSGLAGLH